MAYTAHEDNIIASMVPRFKAETGMDLEFVKLGSGDVIKRVVAEAGNPQADVIWSIGGEQLEANAAVLEKYVPRSGTRSTRCSRSAPTGCPTPAS